MSYRICYTKRAAQDIEKLPKETKKRIGAAILRMSGSPFKYIRKLVDSDLGMFRYRVGEYRVILDIVASDIVILRVGHRRDIYRRKR